MAREAERRMIESKLIAEFLEDLKLTHPMIGFKYTREELIEKWEERLKDAKKEKPPEPIEKRQCPFCHSEYWGFDPDSMTLVRKEDLTKWFKHFDTFRGLNEILFDTVYKDFRKDKERLKGDGSG